MVEIWKDIKGYEGLYQISNLGRIKSLKREVDCGKGERILEERVLKNMINIHGYYYIHLRKEKRKHAKTIHRLVAEAFIDNKANLPVVNHIDGNKLNNSVQNLEWCTYSENSKHAYINNLKEPPEKEVLQYNINGDFIRKWKSGKVAAKELNICYCHISSCCTGKSKVAGGFVWKHATEKKIDRHIDTSNNIRKSLRKVKQYNTNGDFISKYNSIAEASRNTKISNTAISNCLSGRAKTAGNYMWEYF